MQPLGSTHFSSFTLTSYSFPGIYPVVVNSYAVP